MENNITFETNKSLIQQQIVIGESRNTESRFHILPKYGPLQMVSRYVCGPRFYVFGGYYQDCDTRQFVKNDTVYYYDIDQNKWIICPLRWRCSNNDFELEKLERYRSWQEEKYYSNTVVTEFNNGLGVFTSLNSHLFDTACTDSSILPCLPSSHYRTNMVGCQLDKNTTMIFRRELQRVDDRFNYKVLPSSFYGNILSASGDHWITHRFDNLALLESYCHHLVCTTVRGTVSLIGSERHSSKPVHYQYDYQSGQWLNKCIPPISQRKGISLNNNIYVVGALNGGRNKISSRELVSYDPREDHWRFLQPHRMFCYRITSFEDKIWCIGDKISGNDQMPIISISEYDTKANKWNDLDICLPERLRAFQCKILE